MPPSKAGREPSRARAGAARAWAATLAAGLGALSPVAAGALAPLAAGAAGRPAPGPRGAAPTAGAGIVVDQVHRMTNGPLALRRVSFGIGPDRRLRAVITMFDRWRNDQLLAGNGPPGSVCLRLWVGRARATTPADYLVCATVRADAKTLVGRVLRNRRAALPRVIAGAQVVRPTGRSVILRFAQSAVGRPARVALEAESTPAGCGRPACVDTAPPAPAVARLTLDNRAKAKAGRAVSPPGTGRAP